MKRLSLIFVFSLLWACSSKSAEPARVVYDDWHKIKIGDARAGYERTTRKMVGERVVTEKHTEFKMRRLGGLTELTQDDVFEETADGRPIRSVHKRLMSLQETEFVLEIDGNKFTLVTTTAGNPTKRSLEWKSNWTFPAAQERALKGAAMGTELVLECYSVDFGKADRSTVKVIGREKIRIGRDAFDAVKLQVEQDSMKGITITQWRDAEARELRTEYVMMGQTFTFERCEPGEALVDSKGGVPEIFTTSMIRPSKPVQDARRVREVLYRITYKESDPDPKVFTFEGQNIEKTEGRTIQLRVRHPDFSGPAPKIPMGDEAMKPYLQPNDYLQSGDAKVMAMARQAVGDETDAWKAAKRIERFVYDKVKNNNFGTAFASAKEVCENLEGDCTEHSVLAAALARAVGLPSRVAVGLAYANGGFGGHMWTEVWVGRWVPIDPTLLPPGDFVDATHIKMGESSMNEPGVGAEFANILVYLGRLDLDIVESK
jgi:hypothetical protein